MKKYIFIIPVLVISIFIIFLDKNNGLGLINKKIYDSNVVYVKAFVNYDCNKCTKVEEYLEVYKQAGVEFESINIKEYQTKEYKKYFNDYNITKLPFIVFGEELNKYETIANSWDNTFGYKNKNGEYIATDIIPPYFDLKTKKVEGLIDIIYIGDKNCKECYNLENIKNILSKFGLRFNNVDKFDIKSKEVLYLIQKYKIEEFPTVILSSNTNLYKNFSFFWKTIGSIEKDGKYILRESDKLGLKTSN